VLYVRVTIVVMKKATMLSLCSVAPHVAVNNTNILTVARQSPVCPRQQCNVLRSSCKVAGIFVRVESNLDVPDKFSLKSPSPNYMRISAVGSAPILADRRKDVTKLVAPLHDYANALNKECRLTPVNRMSSNS
jgi:hypothetical protein